MAILRKSTAPCCRRSAPRRRYVWSRRRSFIASVRAICPIKQERSRVDLTAKFIDVAGTRTRYHDVGQGEPTILIHGGGPGASGLSNYRKNVEPLAAGRR